MIGFAVPDVNSVQFAVHSILIETALSNAAGYANIDFMIHLLIHNSLLSLNVRIFQKSMKMELTRTTLLCYNYGKE